MRWHCPPDTGNEIRALVVWGRACYFSVTKAPHNIESLRVSGEETFCFFEGQSGVRTRDLRLSKQAAFTTAPGPPPNSQWSQLEQVLVLWQSHIATFCSNVWILNILRRCKTCKVMITLLMNPGVHSHFLNTVFTKWCVSPPLCNHRYK